MTPEEKNETPVQPKEEHQDITVAKIMTVGVVLVAIITLLGGVLTSYWNRPTILITPTSIPIASPSPTQISALDITPLPSIWPTNTSISSPTPTLTNIPTTVAQMAAMITSTTGITSEVSIDSLKSDNCEGGGGYGGLIFRGGVRIPFSLMKNFEIEFTELESVYTYTVMITMLDGEEMTKVLSANYIACYLTGSLDSGELHIPMKEVKRVEFQ